MSRFIFLFVVLLWAPSLVWAQSVTKPWSYPYGEVQVALEQSQPGTLAILLAEGTEEADEILQGILKSTGPLIGGTSYKEQEYPRLYYVETSRRIDSAAWMKLTEVLTQSPDITLAAPLLQYDRAEMVIRPELILTFDGAVDEDDIKALLKEFDLQRIRSFSALDPTYLVSFSGSPLKGFELSRELLLRDEIEAAEPNFIHDLPEMAAPNDPLYSSQWDMNNTGQTGGTPGADMHMEAAWDISTGSSDIIVAIIDEGVDVDHPDLIANMVAGFDAVTADPTPGGVPGNANSGDGHGTCCAGIVAASGNNGIGVTGVTWNSKIMPIRIGFGNYWTQTDWIIDGLTWPVDNGADVLSNSWGGGSASTAIQNAVSYGTTVGRGGLGCPNFFASGNDNGGVSYPAAYPEAIAVGASSPCDERKSPSSCDGETWWGSNYGSTLDFVAPGPLTTTVDIAGSGGYASGDYTTSFNGTSSATPHAAGAGALLLAVAPGLTEAEVRTLMRQTADDQVGPPSEDTPGYDIYMGYGRVNCEALLLAVASLVPGPTNLSCNNSGASTSLSWSNGDSYTSVEVTRNGTLLATLSGSATSYTDNNTPVGSTSYSIRGFQGSDPSAAASCNIFSIGGATDLVWAPSAASGTVAGGQGLADALTAAGRQPLVVSSLGDVADLDVFEAVWVNLGIYPSNHVLSSGESSTLDAYLTNGVGGNFLYMEGGDTWAYDSATTLHGRFGISGLADGSADLSTVTGAAGTGCDLSGQSWSYSGENNWMDRLGATGSATVTLVNPSPSYNVGVFNDAGGYRTFGTSFEIAGLNDGASTRADLVAAILNCFGGSPPPPPPPAPVADFSANPTSGETPLTVAFTNLTTGDVSGYSWDFGDGNGSTATEPSHIYTSAGTYTVTLTATGPGGSDTAVCSSCITVEDPPPPPPPPAPVAAFSLSPSSGDAPLSVNFTNESSGDISGYSWDFGDGNTSTASNPSHVYTVAGSYTVTLTATGPGGSDTAVCGGCVVVSDPPPPPPSAPIADFSVSTTSGETPLTVDFSNLSSGDISGYNWDFGDGNGSTATNPSHTYTVAGNYTVTLTATGPGGSDTAICSNCITVTDPPPPPPPAPVADFTLTPDNGDAPLTVAFSNLSSGDISSYSWDFGDGNGSSATSPSHTYTSAGTYTVTLTATGPGGSDTAVCNGCVVVNDPPPPPPPPSTTLYYLSFVNNTFVPGVGTVRDEDVVTYDPATGTWAMFIDGSDVGIGGTDINALSVLADGSVVMSFNNAFTLFGLTGGPSGVDVDDSDLVLFTPTSTGSNTAGSWSFFFDGSDVSLTTNGEDIDGVCVLDDGTFLFSTVGTAKGGGPNSHDENVALFTPTSLGANSGGSWSLFFDGSDVGFSQSGGEDLDGISLDFDGTLLFSTVGSYSGSGSSGADEDVSRFTGTFGGATSGSAQLILDLTALGIDASEDVDALSIR